MLNSGRDIFQNYLYSHFDPIPSRSQAPEIGEKIAYATWPTISKEYHILQEIWFMLCKRWANEFLKDPAPGKDDLQEAFNFYKTPDSEQRIINQIGHRRMESPDDGSMIDLVNPTETSSSELFRLADKLEIYGNQCIERSKYIRQLARIRQKRGL